MEGFELPQIISDWVHYVLAWVGFGTLVGLLARAIMPGRDPGGPVANLLMGIGGTIVGSGLLTFFWDGQRITPISPPGFIVGTAGAFILLFFYRLLAGRIFREDGQGRPRVFRRHHAHTPVTVIRDV